MDKEETNKIIYFKQANTNAPKEISVGENEAILIANGQVTKLDSFVLSGDDVDENRLVLSYNTSISEALVYKEYLDVQLKMKLIEQLNEED